jgi:mono/diheme cytochrome c family protein
MAQSCGICHLSPSMGAKTYGPPLNKAAAAGNDEVMRAFILNGSDRMPAFKYYLKPPEIDAIIAYVRTVPSRRLHPRVRQTIRIRKKETCYEQRPDNHSGRRSEPVHGNDRVCG